MCIQVQWDSFDVNSLIVSRKLLLPQLRNDGLGTKVVLQIMEATHRKPIPSATYRLIQQLIQQQYINVYQTQCQ